MTISYRWTEDAINCYNRGCQCQGCFYHDFFSGNQKCQMQNSVLELVKRFGPPGRNLKPTKKIKDEYIEERIKEALKTTPEGLCQTDISKKIGSRRNNGPEFGYIIKNMVERGELESIKAINEKHPRKISVTLYKLSEREEPMNITPKEELALASIKQIGGIGATRDKIMAVSGFTCQQVQGLTNRLLHKKLIVRAGDAYQINALTDSPIRSVAELKQVVGCAPVEELVEQPKKEKIKIEVPRESYVDDDNCAQDDNKGAQDDKKGAQDDNNQVEVYKKKMLAALQPRQSIIELEKLAAAIEVAESLRGYKTGLDKAREIIRLLEAI
ncbi:MAG: hypothetical protein AB1706_10255 [Pseudomonadota bacterium]